MNNMKSAIYGIPNMGAVQNGGAAATPTATASGGTPQMDTTSQSPVATLIGCIVLLVVIRLAWELAD